MRVFFTLLLAATAGHAAWTLLVSSVPRTAGALDVAGCVPQRRDVERLEFTATSEQRVQAALEGLGERLDEQSRDIADLRRAVAAMTPNARHDDVPQRISRMQREQRSTARLAEAARRRVTGTQRELVALRRAMFAMNRSVDTRLGGIDRRVAKTLPALAADELEPSVLKLYGRSAAEGVSGSTWTMTSSGNRTFAVSALHAAKVYRSRTPGELLMALPGPVAQAARAVGVFAGALTHTSAKVSPLVDVVMVEVDASAPSLSGLFAREFEVDAMSGGDLSELPRGTPVVGWSEQMPTVGRALGVADQMMVVAVTDGCVPGNSGSLIVPVRGGSVSKHALGVLTSKPRDPESEQRCYVTPLPTALPAASGTFGAHDTAEACEGRASRPCDVRGRFVFVRAEPVTRETWVSSTCRCEVGEDDDGAVRHRPTAGATGAALVGFNVADAVYTHARFARAEP